MFLTSKQQKISGYTRWFNSNGSVLAALSSNEEDNIARTRLNFTRCLRKGEFLSWLRRKQIDEKSENWRIHIFYSLFFCNRNRNFIIFSNLKQTIFLFPSNKYQWQSNNTKFELTELFNYPGCVTCVPITTNNRGPSIIRNNFLV